MSVAELSPIEAASTVEHARSERFRYLPAVVACLGVGALTLLVLPTYMAYDPWSWLIWGRELDHLTLVTRGSASAFKPLAAFIDMVFAPAGRSAPDLWMALVRGATALSMVLAFEIGRRLQGVVAGVVAALALLTIWNFSSGLALQGMSEPLEMCCCLAALECGLTARYRAATVWLVAASMLEFELTGALVLYGLIFLVWPAKRRLHSAAILALLVALVAFVWVLPDLIAGHGALHAEAKTAAIPIVGGPELARVPALATVREVRQMLLWPLALGWLAELVLGIVWFVRRRALRPMFIPTVIAALFVLGVALLTQLHRATGTTRFLVAACSVGVVAAVCVWAEATTAVADLLTSRISARARGARTRARGARGIAIAAELVVLLVILVLVKSGLIAWRDSVRDAIHHTRSGARAQTQLPDAIAAAGGPGALLACGKVYTGPYEVPHVAWALGVSAPRIWHGPVTVPGGSVVSLRSKPVRISQLSRYRLLPTRPSTGSAWRIYSTCSSGGRAG